ncbi:hypothetical protein Tco_0551750 [Tanacetum coccineum]
MRMYHDLQTMIAPASQDQELLQTVQNYSMHGMGKTNNELHAMLKLHEQTQPKQNAPALLEIRAGNVQKKKNKQKPRFCARGENQGKGKNKHAYDPKPKISPSPKKKNPAKDTCLPSMRLRCLLNIVPTKKVENTPYEVWHGQAPKDVLLKSLGQNFPLPPAVRSIMYAGMYLPLDAFDHDITTDFNRIQAIITGLHADDLKSQTGYVFVLNGGVVD